MFFRDIIGQEIAKEELRHSFQAGIVPHARLFVGADGMGALALAYAYARYINCEAPTQDDACGHCSSCQRFSQFSSLDLMYLFPISNLGSRNLCEDDLPTWRKFLALGAHTTYHDWLNELGAESKRLSIFAREAEALNQRMSYQTAEARFRVLLVWLPERMHEVLGNKLLKLIEEPPRQTIILMVSQEEAAVLGTLRSRMQTIHLRPVDESTIRQALAQESTRLTDIDISDIAHRAGGNYRKALDEYKGLNLEGQELLEYFKRILRATVDAQPIKFRTLADELAGISRDEQLDLINYVSQTFRELFISNYNLDQVSYLSPSERPIANYIKACLNADNVGRLLEELNLASRHIAQNVNSKIVFFDLTGRLTAILSQEYKRHKIR